MSEALTFSSKNISYDMSNDEKETLDNENSH